MISFDLCSAEIVTLKIYNSIGEEIETLIQSELPAGQHEIHWSAKNLTSGFYLYSLRAGDFHDSKKMIYQN